jgi:hypothetical protein
MADEDDHLAEAARAMIAAAERGQSVTRVLRRQCPDIYRHIRQLRHRSGLRRLWGRSRNVDDNAHQQIVHPAILHAIGHLIGIPMRGRVVHAGVEHTYGYLFSLIDTPHGHKRDRWVQPTIEDGFGISEPTLRPVPARGTLLANLTTFAGHIAFRDRPAQVARLRRLVGDVSPVVEQYPYAGLHVVRVVEEVAPESRVDGLPVELRTDLVAFPRPPADSRADNHLLVYSVRVGRAAPVRLITAFPVAQGLVDCLTAPQRQGEATVDGLPYNAHVRGLNGPFRVRRHVVPPASPHAG